MQRVVRSSLIGLLAIAGLTACGDKVEVQGPTSTPPGVVRGVTITPPSANMAVGDKVTFSASVNADAGVADRTVSWSSSDASVASVDQNGVVTALKVGTSTIIAKSKADQTQQASALVTVGGGGGGGGAPATVTISSVNQTVCVVGGACTSVPANLANVFGQIDVTLNVEPGNQRLLGVDLVLNCTGAGNSGTDTVVVSQTLASTNVAAEAASAPVTVSFNTASFNSTTGATAFKNGNCTVKARARTNSAPGGAVTTVTSTGQTITLNNPDVIIGNMTASKTRINPLTGLSWNGDTVTVTTLPVFFSNRTAASTVINFEGRQVRLGAGAQSVKFIDRNDPSIVGDTLNIDNITDANAQNQLAVNVIDSNGQNFANGNNSIVSAASYLAAPNAPVSPFATSPFRLDTKKPASGTLNIANNAEQNTGPIGYLNGSFRFAADSAAGYRGADVQGVGGNAGATCGSLAGTYVVTRTSNCDFGGVDSVTVVFEVGSAATATTWTRVTSPASLSETNTNTANTLRQITTDRLGNADTTFVCSVNQALANPASANGAAGQCTQFSSGTRSGGERFGVDRTAPTQTFTAGELNQATFTNPLTPGNYFLTITDNLSGNGTYAGAGTVLVAQTRQTNFSYSGGVSAFENRVYSNTAAAARPGSADVAVVGYNVDNSPCLIGRFNASQSNAGPNALPTLARDGSTIGWCTPVPYQPAAGGPAGTSGIPAGNVVGYVRTEVIPSDQAGNTGAVFLSTIYVDPTAPVIQNVDAPGTVAGGATVSFPTAAADTAGGNGIGAVGDLVGAVAQVNYANGIVLQYPADNSIGTAFDNVLTRTGTANPTVTNFIKALFISTGGTTPPPNTAVVNAGPVNLYVNDAVPQYSAPFAAQLSPNAGGAPTQITGTNTVYQSGSVTRTFTGGFVAAENNATVQNCPAAGCNAGTATTTNQSTTITATATGATGTFTNPFSLVQVWYRQGGTTDPYVLAGNATVLGTQDNGTVRTWQYSFTFDPPVKTPASPQAPTGRDLTANASTVEYIVIGSNSNGDAVATPARTITIANP